MSSHWAFQVLFQLPKARLQKGDPSNWQIKKQLFRPWKVVFSFSTSRHLCEQPVSFSGAFLAAQSAIAKGRPFQLANKKKTTFQALKSCFFHFHPQASFSGAFPAAQSAIAKGRPFQLANKKMSLLPWSRHVWKSFALKSVGWASLRLSTGKAVWSAKGSAKSVAMPAEREQSTSANRRSRQGTHVSCRVQAVDSLPP